MRAMGADGYPPGQGENEASPAPTRFCSLRLRLLGLVFLMLVPWLVLTAYTQADERKAAIANVNDDAMRLIHIVTSNQAAQIEAARQLLTAFARLPQIHTKDAAACNAFLAEMLKAYPLYLNIAVADPNGNLVCSALPFRTPINVADRAYFKMALQMRDFAIGDYQVGRITNLPAISYAYPLVGPSREVDGIVFVGAEPELAHGRSRERRVSAGRHHGSDRSQWNGARPHARCRRLDRQTAARTAGPRHPVQPKRWRPFRSRRRARHQRGCGPMPR